eukprot:jgi/Psemu1/289613/fgenesh1_pg.377_\
MTSKKRQRRQLRRRKRLERHDGNSVVNKTICNRDSAADKKASSSSSSSGSRHTEDNASSSATQSLAARQRVVAFVAQSASHSGWTLAAAKGTRNLTMTHRYIGNWFRTEQKSSASLVWAATILLASVLIGKVEYLRQALLPDASRSSSTVGIVAVVGSISVLLPIVLLLLVWNTVIRVGDGETKTRNDEAKSDDREDTAEQDEWLETIRPLALRQDDTTTDVPVLAASETVRTMLAKWLPFGLRYTSDLRLVYATNVHGRSLPVLYERLEQTGSQHTVLLAEVVMPPPPVVSHPASPPRVIVGMYASHRWYSSPRSYGDGRSFLFHIAEEAPCYPRTNESPFSNSSSTSSSSPLPSSSCWHWSPPPQSDNTTNDDDPVRVALWETFQRSNATSLSLGIGSSGIGAGLQLFDDLTRGESCCAVGFDNDPLVMVAASSSNTDPTSSRYESVVFDVGLVEVYQLVREFDGRPIQ